MNYCPNCGNKLNLNTANNQTLNSCISCGYIDWNNWVNVSCVVAAYTKDNELLVVKLKGKEEGKITLPGGYRELGETLIEAAKREFYEETGMIVNNLKLFKMYTKDEQRLIWITYKGKVEKQEFIENDEVSEVMYIKNINEINSNNLRGELTQKLLNDLFNSF